jgi:hypothetical protein
MDQTPASITATVTALENEYDGRWWVWLSDTGRWWASRRDSLSAGDLAAGCVPFLRADTPDELAERIEEQEALCPPAPEAGLREAPAPVYLGTACR